MQMKLSVMNLTMLIKQDGKMKSSNTYNVSAKEFYFNEIKQFFIEKNSALLR